MSAAQGARYAVDAGGSHTTVRVRHPDGREQSWDRPSCAIAAVGARRSAEQVDQVLTEVWQVLAGAEPLLGCVASSSFPVGAEARVPDRLVSALANSACRGRVVVVNDVVPLLWAEPVRGHGVVINSGTGSVVIARHADRGLVKLGGHEHILSDLGSAYSIARAGLRAATLAVDGLGPPTDLVGLAGRFYHRTLPELGRQLAELERARSEIARFAGQVVAAAGAGDAEAARILSSEAAALGGMALTAIRRLELGPQPRVALAGGVLRASEAMRELVLRPLLEAGLRPRTAVVDSVAAVLDFAAVADREDDALLTQVGGLVLTQPGRAGAADPGAGAPAR